jgi:hypothetical protein
LLKLVLMLHLGHSSRLPSNLKNMSDYPYGLEIIKEGIVRVPISIS